MTRKVKRERGAVYRAPVLPAGAPRVEICRFTGGRHGVLLTACDAICAYSRETVGFVVSGETVEVRGTGLWCKTYGNRTAEVVGNVVSVHFGREKS